MDTLILIRRWRPAQIAGRYLRLARGAIDARWYFNPTRDWEVYACFVSEESARAMVLEVLRAGRPSALQLADKPEMERRVVEFAGWEPETA